MIINTAPELDNGLLFKNENISAIIAKIHMESDHTCKFYQKHLEILV